MWLLNMQWRDLLFAHWPVPATALAPFIPAPLTLDTFEGQAWLGVVPFRMANVGPLRQEFPELNVRTYVRHGSHGGVWFFSLDAAHRLAVRTARRFFHLPYCDAQMAVDERDTGAFHYRSTRTHRGEPPARLDVTYRPTGPAFSAPPGSLDHWLTERYSLFSQSPCGTVYRGDVEHAPWPLQPATADWRLLDMTQALGLTLAPPPARLAFARHLDVRASTIRRI